MAMVFVFLVLAAQYESWAVPFSVLFGLPIGVFGALLSVSLVGLENNVYVQIGIVALMGLAAKNAILIVEFAKEAHERKGMSLYDASMEGARLRFRPIMMTAFAFILGVVPLVVASGAGAAARVSIGLAVFGGMLFASTVGLFFIPMLYSLIQGLAYRVGGNAAAAHGKPELAEAEPKGAHA
jgi:HAE1 family hydrophobic/amphiphilic exporter-1/multidrug efflux pump